MLIKIPIIGRAFAYYSLIKEQQKQQQFYLNTVVFFRGDYICTVLLKTFHFFFRFFFFMGVFLRVLCALYTTFNLFFLHNSTTFFLRCPVLSYFRMFSLFLTTSKLQPNYIVFVLNNNACIFSFLTTT